MPVPQQVLDLIERFANNRAAYRSGRYNEAQARQELMNPLFEALGWDVANRQGYSERFKEVVHEDSLKVRGSTKAPDYAFRLGGQRVFFVEAKRPSVDIREDTHPAYQLRRYAWSAKLPVSILTDFEEFAVYDCRIRPVKTDNAATARVLYLRYTDLPQQWDTLVGLFAPEAIRKGALERFVASNRIRKGTAEVDAAFLAEIEGWRETLARNIALRNPGLTVRDLNFAVQATIDRIIFLRICEDRGIEPYGRLRDTVEQGAGVYPRLADLFRQADERYNSGLFYFRPEKDREEAPDEFTLSLTVDDKVLTAITRSLYYPDSPYEFSALPANILGQVYEQFLGKVIRLTAGGRAKVEEKPEVKKAGGVYYTPTYIVDYIVERTVGKLLEGKTPRQIWGSRRDAPLRILDPACGSGTFLLEAYQHLLDWYLEQYGAQDVETNARQDRIYRDADGGWQLTTTERKRILTTHIFGVDIDPQAVEVTKLSLLLKVLEGEVLERPGTQISFVQERVLPDLGANIRCGNSLIGSDYYQQATLGLMDDETMYRINAFDWEKGFPRPMAAGGFDAVIGNPPYVRQETLREQKEYLRSHYEVYHGVADLYTYFIEKGLALLKPVGLFSMIVSNKWLRSAYGRPLRSLLTTNASVLEIVDFAGLPVFSGATVRTLILVCVPRPGQTESVCYLAPVPLDDFRAIHRGGQVTELVGERAIHLPARNMSSAGWSLSSPAVQALVEKTRRSATPLKGYAGPPFFGIKTGLNKAFIVDRQTRDRLVASDPRNADIIRPIVGGRDVRRYSVEFKSKFLIWTYIGVPIRRFPAVFDHLHQFRGRLQKRSDQGNHWWELRPCNYYDRFSSPKIMYPDIATSCRFVVDREGYFGTNTTYIIPGDNLYLLGILNSALGNFYLAQACAGLEGAGTTYLRFFGQYMEAFPVRTIDFDDPADVARHDRMVAMVEHMLALHKQLADAKTPQAKNVLQQQIEVTDRAIDALVYELYGLTDEEIAIVEKGRMP